MASTSAFDLLGAFVLVLPVVSADDDFNIDAALVAKLIKMAIDEDVELRRWRAS